MFEGHDLPIDLLELGDRIQFSLVLVDQRLVKRTFLQMKQYAGKLNTVAGGPFEGRKVV